MRGFLKEHTNPPVFIISGIVALFVVLWGVLSPASISAVASVANTFVTTNFEWLYIFGTSALLIFVVGLVFTRFGKLRLGPDDSRPQYSNLSWFAMLFTAGMGIGLVFYAASEPVTHFTSPPTGAGGTPEAAENAMLYTFYHWLLHPWAVYIVLGLSLGYFAYRKNLPLRPASALYPIFGERIYGPIGHAVDILAVFGTLFGLATSLGIGGQQVGAGLNTLFGIENTTTLQVVIILAITSVAVASVMFGIDKGIRRLSLINLWLAFGLMILVFIAGPSIFLLNSLTNNVGVYLQNLPSLAFETFPGDPGGAAQEWQAGWTLFYWGWWISWSPFVGLFLARISYGRTIRQFILGAMLAPVAASMVWLTVFGDSVLNILLRDPDNALATAAPENSMFVLISQLLPAEGIGALLATLASVVTIVVVVLFFATSSDSGSLVIDILTNGGDPNPRWQQRLFWAILEGVIAAVLLVAGATSGTSALSALQTASIIAGLPFSIILILMAVGLAKSLRAEGRKPGRDSKKPRSAHPVAGRTPSPASPQKMSPMDDDPKNAPRT